MKMCEEMKKLRIMLNEKGIQWVDNSTITSPERIEAYKKAGVPDKYADLTMHRTQFWYENYFFSVIHGFGSYGEEEGLLELRISDNEPIGYLTADTIMSILDHRYLTNEEITKAIIKPAEEV